MENGLKFTPTSTDSQKDFINEFGTKLSGNGSKRLFDSVDWKDEYSNPTIAIFGAGQLSGEVMLEREAERNAMISSDNL